jgi:nucleotidyltransferase/DNA polymerase involved in DNA repair
MCSGVQQKYLLVTCNYEARRRGVGKMKAVSDSLKVCPDLIVKNGEDLTRYRETSEAIYSILQQANVTSAIERLNLDEIWLDGTSYCSHWYEDVYIQAVLSCIVVSIALLLLTLRPPCFVKLARCRSL